jgi:hypothetical protein
MDRIGRNRRDDDTALDASAGAGDDRERDEVGTR